MISPELMKLMGDIRIRCIFSLLKGRDVPEVCRKYIPTEVVERFISGLATEDDLRAVYDLVPSLKEIRDRTGIDIVGKLIEIRRKLESEKVADVAQALTLALATLGVNISEGDVASIGKIVDMFSCVKLENGIMYVDNACLDSIDVPEELKNQVRMVVAMQSVWA